MAGNVLTGSLATVNGVTYLYHADESVHNGLHRWKITGLDTVKVEQAVFPSTLVPFEEEGIDLLAGLPRAASLSSGTAGWTREPAADITTHVESNYFTVSTTVKTADRFKSPDLFVHFRQASGQFTVSRDLGNHANLGGWKLKGRINFEGHTPTQAQFKGGALLEVLDAQEKVLARFDPRQGQVWGSEIRANDKVLLQQEDMRVLFGRNQPFEISVSAGTYTFSYAGLPPQSTATPIDAAGNWRDPKRLRMLFFTHNQADNYARTMGLSELRFVPMAR